jgi:hypothetical protein
MAATLEAMSVPDAIERTIREISAKYSLNARDIRCCENDDSSKRIQWNSHCGVLGDVRFRIPLAKFETNLEEGIGSVSTLISFATLLDTPANHRFAEKVRDAGRYGSPNLYHLDSSHQNQVNVYIGFMTSNAFGPSIGAYRLIQIRYEVNQETGQYHWTLPDDFLESYADVIAQEDDNGSDPGAGGLYGDSSSGDEDEDRGGGGGSGKGLTNEWEAYRQMGFARREVTAYESIGLVNVDSPSIPVLEATSSIRQYSGYTDPNTLPPITSSTDSLPGLSSTETHNPRNAGTDLENENENETPRGPRLARRETCYDVDVDI